MSFKSGVNVGQQCNWYLDFLPPSPPLIPLSLPCCPLLTLYHSFNSHLDSFHRLFSLQFNWIESRMKNEINICRYFFHALVMRETWCCSRVYSRNCHHVARCKQTKATPHAVPCTRIKCTSGKSDSQHSTHQNRSVIVRVYWNLLNAKINKWSNTNKNKYFQMINFQWAKRPKQWQENDFCSSHAIPVFFLVVCCFVRLMLRKENAMRPTFD